MIVRSPVLSRELRRGKTLNWGNYIQEDPENTYLEEWLCHKTTNKIWNLDKFEQIRLVVSNKPVADAIKITAYEDYWFQIYGILKNNNPTRLHGYCTYWLEENFPTSQPLWVWIEEAQWELQQPYSA